MRTVSLAPVAMIFLSGCVNRAVEVMPQAAGVKVVREDDRPFRCKIIAEIHGVSRGEDEAKARKGAENDMRNQAASLRANYAMIEIDRSKNVGITTYKEVFLGGKALQCNENPG